MNKAILFILYVCIIRILLRMQSQSTSGTRCSFQERSAVSGLDPFRHRIPFPHHIPFIWWPYPHLKILLKEHLLLETFLIPFSHHPSLTCIPFPEFLEYSEQDFHGHNIVWWLGAKTSASAWARRPVGRLASCVTKESCWTECPALWAVSSSVKCG